MYSCKRGDGFWGRGQTSQPRGGKIGDNPWFVPTWGCGSFRVPRSYEAYRRSGCQFSLAMDLMRVLLLLPLPFNIKCARAVPICGLSDETDQPT